ncbi:MAG: hypothetical protein ABJK59_04750 [Erythrobacter sp.]|uniref:hypothetical protein n=1 Tax=Erythrobacter sp. TaxID=1042 RepID=UPI00329824F0
MSEEIARPDLISAKLRQALALQVMEDNPLTDDEVAMFKMFEAKRWSDERCRAYIMEQLSGASDTPLAAE